MSLTSSSWSTDHPAVQTFLRRTNNPWLMQLFFWRRLPTLRWWGVRVVSISPEAAAVSIPYGWRTQNPFQSTYFAALAGAAELSTGLLVIMATEGRGRVSMLVTHLEAQYTKKATQTITFRCTQGADIINMVEQAIQTGEGQQMRVETIGTQPDGQEVARLWITWSVRSKTK